jgi:hypothetical protein
MFQDIAGSIRDGLDCMVSERKKIKIKFTDFWPLVEAGKQANPIHSILSKRFDLEIADEPDFVVYSCFGASFLKYQCVRIFYTGENVRPNFNECDYAVGFDYPISDKNYRLPLYALMNDFDKSLSPIDIEAVSKSKTRFCNFVYSNKRAKERIAFFRMLTQYKKVDSGGRVLNNMGYLVKDKAEFLKPYKFTIAFENSSHPGYTTEKIWEAKKADTVPIYWGNPLIDQDFNPKSFINCHEHRNFDEVIERIIEVDNSDELYKQYLAEPLFCNNVVNEFANRENLLDWFEPIFEDPHTSPVGANWKNSWVRVKYIPRQLMWTIKPMVKKLLEKKG